MPALTSSWRARLVVDADHVRLTAGHFVGGGARDIEAADGTLETLSLQAIKQHAADITVHGVGKTLKVEFVPANDCKSIALACHLMKRRVSKQQWVSARPELFHEEAA